METDEQTGSPADDASALRKDMETFIGPNAESYLTLWDKSGGDEKNLQFGWLWPGLFVPDFWLLYRKQYPVFFVVLFLSVFVGLILPAVFVPLLLFPEVGLWLTVLLHLFFAVMGKRSTCREPRVSFPKSASSI